MRCLLFCFSIAFCFDQACAQPGNITLGARAGLSLSTFSKDRQPLPGPPGVVAGVVADYEVSQPVKIILALDYHQLCGSASSTEQGRDGSSFKRSDLFTIHLTEVSAVGAYKIPVHFLGSATPFIVAGGSAGYNWLATNKRTTTYYFPDYSFKTTGKEIVTKSFSPVLYAVQAGLHFEFLIEDSFFSAAMFDLRYRRNINALANGLTLSGGESATDVYSNSVLFTLGFKF